MTITLLYIRNIWRFIELCALLTASNSQLIALVSIRSTAATRADDGGKVTHTEWIFYAFETIPIALVFICEQTAVCDCCSHELC